MRPTFRSRTSPSPYSPPSGRARLLRAPARSFPGRCPHDVALGRGAGCSRGRCPCPAPADAPAASPPSTSAASTTAPNAAPAAAAAPAAGDAAPAAAPAAAAAATPTPAIAATSAAKKKRADRQEGAEQGRRRGELRRGRDLLGGHDQRRSLVDRRGSRSRASVRAVRRGRRADERGRAPPPRRLLRGLAGELHEPAIRN